MMTLQGLLNYMDYGLGALGNALQAMGAFGDFEGLEQGKDDGPS